MVKPKFQKYLLNLSKTNIANMKKGKPTVLKHTQMDNGSTPIYMTARQYNKVKKAHEKKKGVKLHLSDEEFQHNEKAGEGFMDLFKRASRSVKGAVEKIGRVAKPVMKAAKPVVKKVVKAAKPIIKKAVASALKEHLGEEGANITADALVDAGEDIVAGSGSKKLPRGKHLSGLDATVGGKVDFINTFKNLGRDISRGAKQVGRQVDQGAKAISRGYKKNVRNTPIGSAIRTAIKQGIPVAAGMAATAAGQPELAPVASAVAAPLADMAVEKAGLGVLQANHSNFLNNMHPALHPHIPTQGVTDLVRKGGMGVYPAGYKHGGSFLPAGGGLVKHHDQGMVGGMLGSAMMPLLPARGVSDIARDSRGNPVPIHQSSDFFSGSG